MIVWSSARSECPGKQEVLGRGRPCRSKGRKEEEARLDGHRILPILVTIYTHTPFLDTIYTSTRPAYTQAPWSPFNVRAKIHHMIILPAGPQRHHIFRCFRGKKIYGFYITRTMICVHNMYIICDFLMSESVGGHMIS